jgi:uncharacterized protein
LKFEYTYLMNLPQKVVWKWMKSAEVIKHSINGCQSFVETKTGMYEGKINVQLGPLKDDFSLVVKRVKEKIPDTYVLEVMGKGSLGEVNGEIDLSLEDRGNSTKLSISADIELRGTLVLAADRLEGRDMNRLAEPFLQRFEKEIKKAIYHARRRG